ncbi:MAG TPA: glyoxalase [Xanthomonadales bacterium]|nr:glyoxalase [Xanthomonadales bacterium]
MTAHSRPRFHLAFPVTDLEAARAFYGGILGCPLGRESQDWIDFDFHGHQIVAHRVPVEQHPVQSGTAVDGHLVPAFHFGLLVDWDDFDPLAERLRQAGVPFIIEPYLRFAGLAGEQKTLFVRDPSGNALEFKSFRDERMIFARE